jgi:hypothetical protein
LDRPRACEAAPGGERSESNRHTLYASTGFFFIFSAGGMRTPDRGSTTGKPVGRPRRSAFLKPCVGPAGAGRRVTASARVNPPSPPYFKKSSYACTGFFRMWHRRHPRVGSNASPGLPDRTRQVARLSAAPPGGCPKQQSPASRALLTV